MVINFPKNMNHRTLTDKEIRELHKDLETKEFNHKVLFLGEDKEDVIELLSNMDLEWRIIEEDNKPYIVTRDYKPERLNFTIKDNVIIEISYG